MPRTRLQDHATILVSGREMRLLLDLLERARKNGTLTAEQLRALCDDPEDLRNTFEGVDILSAWVDVKRRGR